jgi:iron(III) transport system ATP-binding protein
VSIIELSGVGRRFGSTIALHNLNLAVGRGEILALLGPSGSGKTTALRLIAGFDRPTSGRILLNDRVVADVNGGAWVPSERRGVGMVFQDLALFPHLTVAENVAFGLRDLPRPERARRESDVLRLVEIEDLAKRYPDELSGGQQQRVALARALAPKPDIVLLDEPFGSLDAELRDQVREEVRRILRQAGATVIFVTHDQAEAFALADRVAVMNAGCLEQVDVPLRIYHAPATRFVADFVGHADFIPGVTTAKWLETEAGRLENPGVVSGLDVEVMIRPDEIDVVPDPAGPATVISRRFRGNDHLYTLALPSGRHLHSVRPSTELVPNGMRVRPVLRPTNFVVFHDGLSVASACLVEECRCALALAHQARVPTLSMAGIGT